MKILLGYLNKFTPVVFAIAILLVMTGIAIASSGSHFKSATDSFCSNHDLCISFDEVGVGSSTISYDVAATVNATYCGSSSAGGSTLNVASTRNNVMFSGDSGVGAAATATANLHTVGYSNITITDTTDTPNVTTTVPNLAPVVVGSC